MKELIIWCNSNEGFLAFILSSVTIILSIIALIISVISIREPYKKKVRVEAACSFDEKEKKVYIWITNVGNKVISIRQINVLYKGVHIGGTGSIKASDRILKSTEIKEYIVDAYIDDKEEFFEKGMVTVEDTEQIVYKSSRISPMV